MELLLKEDFEFVSIKNKDKFPRYIEANKDGGKESVNMKIT